MKSHLWALSVAVLFVPLAGCNGPSNSYETNQDTWVFDLTKPLPPIDKSKSDFDISVFHPMNYSISQTDSRLGALGRQFCFPTALAEAFMYLYRYHAPASFPNLLLEGVSPDRSTANPISLVNQLASLCKTIQDNGTDDWDGANCIHELIVNSGYRIKETILITPFSQLPGSARVAFEVRPPTIADLRAAIDNGEVVLISVGRYIYHPGEIYDGGPMVGGTYYSSTGSFKRRTGHEIGIYGYDLEHAWGDAKISLRVLNPLTRFSNDGDHTLYESIMASVATNTNTLSYPDWTNLVFSGPGFSPTEVNLVEGFIHFLPY